MTNERLQDDAITNRDKELHQSHEAETPPVVVGRIPDSKMIALCRTQWRHRVAVAYKGAGSPRADAATAASRIADAMLDDGFSSEMLAVATNLELRRVQRTLATMETMGLVTRETRRDSNNRVLTRWHRST
jgi:predicted Rossmann fold nucleotide-binding protein DprA/Smf involved in DNA uptake